MIQFNAYIKGLTVGEQEAFVEWATDKLEHEFKGQNVYVIVDSDSCQFECDDDNTIKHYARDYCSVLYSLYLFSRMGLRYMENDK